VTHTTYQADPIGWVESLLVEIADAPNQGDEGAPERWIRFSPRVAEAISDLAVGDEIIMVTWFDRGDRDELKTYPGDDPLNSFAWGVQHSLTRPA